MSTPERLHYHHALDTALPVRAIEGVVRLKGWCFAEGGPARPRVQLRLGELRLEAPADQPRPDVATAFPDLPQAAASGFEISGHVPPGLAVAELWAGHERFGWERLLSFSVYAEAAVLHGAIDLPEERAITTNQTIDGWCFHPQREIAEIWLHYGTQRIRCRHYGHERRDVGRQFPHLKQAARAGFSSEDVLKPGEGRIRLRAVDRQGGEFFCETEHVVRLSPADSVHATSDPRLDGRALFLAFTSRLDELPPLRVFVSFESAESLPEITAISTALSDLPGDKTKLVILTGGDAAPAELDALAMTDPRIVLAPAWAPDAEAWDMHLSWGEIPDVHGVMAALLTAADRPGLTAVIGDFTTGPDRALKRQPPWSPGLALAGGIHPAAPLLTAGRAELDRSDHPVIVLARARANVVHLAATLVHRPTPSPVAWTSVISWLRPKLPEAKFTLLETPRRLSRVPRASFQPGPITALVLGEKTVLPPMQQRFGTGIEHWLAAATTAGLAAAVDSAPDTPLLLLTPESAPINSRFVATLALHLADAPEAAVQALLVHDTFAPWTEADYFDERTRHTLGAFDPAYSFWCDRSLTLFTRQVPYLTFPGLLITRQRLREMGGLDPLFSSPTGAMLDLGFRLRQAGTPPLVCTDARLIAQPAPALPAFETSLLLDRWDHDDFNPLRIRPLVDTETLA